MSTPWERRAAAVSGTGDTEVVETSIKPFDESEETPWDKRAREQNRLAAESRLNRPKEVLQAEHVANLAQSSPTVGQQLDQLTEGIYGGIGRLAQGAAAIPGALVESVRQTVADPLGAVKAVPGALLEMGSDLANYPVDQFGKLLFGTPKEAGEVIGENVVPLAAGPAVGIAGRAVQGAAGVSARKLVNTIIKPSLKDQAFKKDPTGAILRNKIVGNTDEQFAANVQAKIDEFHGMTDAQLAKSTKAVPVNDVTALLDDEVKRIKGSVGISNKEALLSRIEELQSDILGRYGGQSISLRELHALRKEIDSSITRFTMDAVEQGANASKYAARSGINKLIRNQEPKVEKWMREESELLSAKEALERQANRQRNAGFGGPGDIAAGVLGEVLAQGAGVPGTGALTGLAARHALGSTAVKSRAAKGLHKLSGGETAAVEFAPTGELVSETGGKLPVEANIKLSQVSEMTAGKINKALDRNDQTQSKITDDLIAAGRGSEKTSEILAKSDPLSQRLKDALDERSDLKNEITRRYGPDAPSRLPKGFGPVKRSEQVGTFTEQEFEMPGTVQSTYKGPERRKEPRGTFKEEEFNWPESVSELKNPTTEKYSGYSPKRGKIVLNDAAMDKLTNMIGAKKLNGAEVFSGTGVSGADAAGRIFIQSLKREFPKEFAMVPTNKPLTIQRVGDSGYFKQEARHEGLHRAVNEVLGEKLEINPIKLGVKGRKIFGEIHGKALTEGGAEGRIVYGAALRTKGGYASGRKAEEVFADLATGNPMRMGLTRVEGLQLLGDILEQLTAKHGADKVEALMKRFAPRFYERAPERTGMKLPRFKAEKPLPEIGGE